MWVKPKPPEPPKPPPTPLEALKLRLLDAMFDELDRQNEAGEIDAAGYWDREWGRLDGEPNWDKVAEAVLAALRLAPEWSVVTDMGVWGKSSLGEANARRMAAMYDDMELRSRLVSPWVEEQR